MRYLPLLLIFFWSCSPSGRESADLLVFNGKIYTVDEDFSMAEAFVVKDGKILEIGPSRTLMNKYDVKERVDAGGRAVYPGFIDAHCHFYGYGTNLFNADLTGTKSYDEVLQRLVDHQKELPTEWVLGRGWDQNDWEVKEFPDKAQLDSLFPDKPVVLRRIDGHAVLCNSEALRRAGITANSKIPGGIIEKSPKTGEPTGVLVDNAMDPVLHLVPALSRQMQIDALMAAQKDCFNVGLTSLSDAGLDRSVIELLDSLQKENLLKMRIYAMITSSQENIDYYLSTGPQKTERLNVRSFKFFADGALGSRGACLIEPYSDKQHHHGMLLNDPKHYKEFAEKLYDKGFQMNTHCIGDSANRLMLNIYGDILKGTNDRRWRIEHAQVVKPEDIQLFTKYTIVPSVQPTHATSDMYWAEERLGPERIQTAYAYKALLKAVGFVASGSDFPIENINPLYGFFAAVSRQDFEGFPKGGFNPENALTREEALKAMTIWAAISNFEDQEKGSIEPGKFADFVILEKDIMTIDLNEIPKVKVLATYINGEKVN
jgi:predicted amidohydrolase YtcJ